MFNTRTTLAAFAVLTSMSFVAQQPAAAHHGYSGAAGRIQGNSALLNQEFRHHYHLVAGYRHLLSNSKEIFLRAQRIRLLSLNGGSAHVMVNDLHVLDHAHHNLEQLLHVHGRTPAVHTLMTRIASDINSLRYDLARFARYNQCRPVYYVQPVRTANQKPTRNYGEIRSGWTRTLNSISGGSSSRSSSSNRRSLSSR